ncbi:flavin reductase family protein [Algivirga pacifica]|uniref:Flavin reductase family protein n=1 Tax=Algivirga pacifica TaxID=1162670 RepID=A0ABP9D9H6_9BACT
MRITIDPKEVDTATFHRNLLASVGPRPIAFASTMDKEGNVNLSPFSFFNAFSANPPILIFSPARRVRNNTIKHTLENVREIPEVVIGVVDYSIVEQMSLASTEFDKGVNEFAKAGFTEEKAIYVKPPLIGEALVQFECKVKEVIALGDEGGAGNLIICEVLLMHAKKTILDKNGIVDSVKLDLVGRMGGNWYVRANRDAMFEVPKPAPDASSIGIDALPEEIRKSGVLTGNNLARLGSVTHMPTLIELEEIETYQVKGNPHELASFLLDDGKIMEAWKVLLTTFEK